METEAVTEVNVKELMRLYGVLSTNKLEKSTAEAYAAEVKKAVEKAQQLADNVVNALTVGRKTDQQTGSIGETPADLEKAAGALRQLAKSVPPVVEHWRPFIEAVSSALGEKVEAILPRGMVPDPEGLEKRLDEAQSEILHLMSDVEHTRAEAADTSKKLTAAEEGYASAVKQLNEAVASAESMTKRNADLAAENEALKTQLAKSSTTVIIPPPPPPPDASAPKKK